MDSRLRGNDRRIGGINLPKVSNLRKVIWYSSDDSQSSGIGYSPANNPRIIPEVDNSSSCTASSVHLGILAS